MEWNARSDKSSLLTNHMDTLPTSMRLLVLRMLRPKDRVSVYKLVPDITRDFDGVEARRIANEDRAHDTMSKHLNDAEWNYGSPHTDTVVMAWHRPPPINVDTAKQHLGVKRNVDWDRWFNPETPIQDLIDCMHLFPARNPFFRVFNETEYNAAWDMHEHLTSNGNDVAEAMLNNPAYTMAMYGYYPTFNDRVKRYETRDGHVETYEMVYQRVHASRHQWYVFDCGQLRIVDPHSTKQFRALLQECVVSFCADWAGTLVGNETFDGTVGEHLAFARFYHDPNTTLATPGVFEELSEYMGYNMRLAKKYCEIKPMMESMRDAFPSVLYFDETKRKHADIPNVVVLGMRLSSD